MGAAVVDAALDLDRTPAISAGSTTTDASTFFRRSALGTPRIFSTLASSSGVAARIVAQTRPERAVDEGLVPSTIGPEQSEADSCPQQREEVACEARRASAPQTGDEATSRGDAEVGRVERGLDVRVVEPRGELLGSVAVSSNGSAAGDSGRGARSTSRSALVVPPRRLAVAPCRVGVGDEALDEARWSSLVSFCETKLTGDLHDQLGRVTPAGVRRARATP